MTWKTYPKYVDTGVPWLGKVPAHWNVGSFSKFGTFEGGSGFPHEFQGQADEELPFHKVNALARATDTGVLKSKDDTVSRGTARRLGATVLPKSTIVFAKVGAALLLGRIASLSTEACVDNNMMAFIPKEKLTADFARYLLAQVRFELLVNPGAVPSINEGQMKRLMTAVPPLEEQRTITDFLDRETAKIDALIAKQEQLIATLREDRTATITHAVTKGLDPTAEMKDSGVPWIGQMPESWIVSKVRHGFSVVLGKMYQGARQNPGDVELPHLKAGSVTESGLKTDDPMMCWFSPAEVKSLSLKKNDVLVVEGGAIGRCAVLEADMPGWGFQKSLNRVRARGADSPQFLAFLVEAATASGHVSVLCGKATIPHFTAEKLAALEWPHPSPEEQRRIVCYLNRKCAQIDGLVEKAQDVVSILREYRAALITDAVTGKIDVRGVA